MTTSSRYAKAYGFWGLKMWSFSFWYEVGALYGLKGLHMHWHIPTGVTKAVFSFALPFKGACLFSKLEGGNIPSSAVGACFWMKRPMADRMLKRHKRCLCVFGEPLRMHPVSQEFTQWTSRCLFNAMDLLYKVPLT